VQPPIHLSDPAQDAGLNKFNWEAQRIYRAFYILNQLYIVAARTDQGGPALPRRNGSHVLANTDSGGVVSGLLALLGSDHHC
jgi:hypothetical protein